MTSTATSVVVAPAAQVQQILIMRLRPSPENPRKTIDPAFLAQLADSIGQLGIQVPLLVRRTPNAEGDDAPYEIIAGHRRYQAALKLKMGSLPCIVREISDDEAREIMLVENLQREGLPPLEEAEAYQQMFSVAGKAGKPMTAADLAARIGKEESYVRLRLRLLSAEKPVTDALRMDSITLGHALELVRLEPAAQNDCLEWLLYEQSWNGNRGSARRDVPSIAALRRHVQDEVLLDLAKAPFSTKDAKLVPAAGSCVDCKKRTGNNQMLFADVKKGDTCTDPRCFEKKVAAHIDVTVEQLTKQGKTVLRISSNHTRSKETPANALTSGVYNVLRHSRNAKQNCDTTAVGVYVDGERRGRTEPICTDGKCKVHTYSAMSSGSSDDNAKKRRAANLEQKARMAIFKAALEAAGNVEMEDRDYLDIAEYAIRRVDSNGSRRLVQMLGWPKDTLGYQSKVLRQKLDEAGVEHATAIAKAALVSGELSVSHSWGDSKCPRLEALAKDFGVDAKKIRDQVKAEAAAKGKKGAKAKPVKKPTAESEPEAGTCRYCGCTEYCACEGGCSWVDPQETVCSNPECVEKYEATGRALPKVKSKQSKAPSSTTAKAPAKSGKPSPARKAAKKTKPKSKAAAKKGGKR